MNRYRTIILLPILMTMVFAVVSCTDKASESDDGSKKGFYVEDASIAITGLHGFEKVPPILQDTRELFLLRRDNSYIWVGKMASILTGNTVDEQLSEMFYIAQERFNDGGFLLGVELMHAKLEKIKRPARPYVDQLMIIERTPEGSENVTDTERMLHAHEFKRIPEGDKMMMEVLFTAMGDTVYIFTLLTPVEDFLFHRDDALAVFRDLQFEVSRPSGY